VRRAKLPRRSAPWSTAQAITVPRRGPSFRHWIRARDLEILRLRHHDEAIVPRRGRDGAACARLAGMQLVQGKKEHWVDR
jgi:hypothetical protein